MTALMKLKRAVNIHLGAGCVFFVVLSSTILLAKYDDFIHREISSIGKIRLKAREIVQTTNDLDHTIKRVESVLPVNYTEKSARDLMLAAIDEITALFDQADIEMSNIIEAPQTREYQVLIDIRMNLTRYGDILNKIGYLQTMRFPHVSIDNVKMARISTERTLCNIKITVKMPDDGLMARIQDDDED